MEQKLSDRLIRWSSIILAFGTLFAAGIRADAQIQVNKQDIAVIKRDLPADQRTLAEIKQAQIDMKETQMEMKDDIKSIKNRLYEK